MLRRAALCSAAPRRPRAMLATGNTLYSTHSRSSAPTLEPLRHGGVCAFFWRTVQRQRVFWRHNADGVFAPDASTQDRLHMFAYVNAPTQTIVALPEFLEGAKRAAGSVLEASRARDFVDWRAGHATVSASASKLQQWCTPAAFTRLVEDACCEYHSTDEIAISHVSLARAAYDRCTPSELATDPALASEVAVYRPWALGARVERLQLGVRVVTNERASRPPPSSPVRTTHCVQRIYHIEFLSDVSTLAAVDWRVAAITQIG